MLQIFPRKVNGRIERKQWRLDLDAAGAIAQRMEPERLQREAKEMVEHFPRWILTLSVHRDRVVCKCGGMTVFDRGMRCVSCDSPIKAPRHATLSWFGLMPPVGINNLERLKAELTAAPPAHHVVGERAPLGSYLLVPLVASYPDDYPDRPPRIAYLPGFFNIPSMPKKGMSHTYHMYDQGMMCLFAPHQWQPSMSVREVLQQRAYAHVVKMLNFGNGKTNAFGIVT